MRVMVLRRWLPGTCSARSCSPLAKLDREAPTWQAAAWAEGHLVIRDAGIKISSVATDILGVSGRAMLAALIEGEDDAQVMADMARGRMRTKIPALVQALTGSFGEHHRAGHHRRDRIRHDPLPHPSQPRFLGRGLPGPPRVRRQTTLG